MPLYATLPYFLVFVTQFVVLTLCHWSLYKGEVKKWLTKADGYKVLFGSVIIFQLVSSALLQREVGDVMLFSGAGWHLRHQIDFYFIDANHTQYPFFPFLIFLHAGLNWIHELGPELSFSFYLKIVLLMAVYSISALIRKISKTNDEGKLVQLQFVTHPLLTLAVFFHGQVDVILLAFFVWAVYYLEISKKPKQFWLGVVAYAMSVASKTWSIIFLPWMVLQVKSWWKRVFVVGFLAFFLIGITFVYTRLVDGSSVRTVLPAVMRPGGPVGEWGVSLVLRPWAEELRKTNIFVFAGAMAITYALVVWRRPKAWLAYVLLILGVYVGIPNFGIQYLFWVVPLLYLARLHQTTSMTAFTVVGGVYAFLSYINIALTSEVVPFWIVRAFGFVVWALCIWWIHELVQRKDVKE